MYFCNNARSKLKSLPAQTGDCQTRFVQMLTNRYLKPDIFRSCMVFKINLNDLVFSGPRHLLQHRIHEVSQAGWILNCTRGPLHALEADRILPGRLHYLQEGRGALRCLPHEAQPSKQTGPGLRDRCRLQGRALFAYREEQVSHAVENVKTKNTRICFVTLTAFQLQHIIWNAPNI